MPLSSWRRRPLRVLPLGRKDDGKVPGSKRHQRLEKKERRRRRLEGDSPKGELEDGRKMPLKRSGTRLHSSRKYFSSR